MDSDVRRSFPIGIEVSGAGAGPGGPAEPQIAEEAPRPSAASVRCGELEVDLLGTQVLLSGRALELTRRERELVQFLVKRTNRAVSRSQLVEEIWTSPGPAPSNVLDVNIARIRHKLGAHAGLIQTVRGFGYRFGVPLAG
jgi:DNA-binding response OmpR family regulator